jgi:hypothetical protein
MKHQIIETTCMFRGISVVHKNYLESRTYQSENVFEVLLRSAFWQYWGLTQAITPSSARNIANT